MRVRLVLTPEEARAVLTLERRRHPKRWWQWVTECNLGKGGAAPSNTQDSAGNPQNGDGR